MARRAKRPSLASSIKNTIRVRRSDRRTRIIMRRTRQTAPDRIDSLRLIHHCRAHRHRTDFPVQAGMSGAQDPHVVLLAVRISGDQGETFAAGLRHQHPVEWIPVNHWQAPGSYGVGETDRKFPEAAVADTLGKICRRGDLAERLLDGDFPDRGRADADIRLLIKPVLDLIRQLWVIGQSPQHDMGVQQQAHDVMPNSAAMDSLTASESQSGARMSLPRSDPRPLRLILPASGITLATGRPARLMMISSPCSTRSMIRDRLVFAS